MATRMDVPPPPVSQNGGGPGWSVLARRLLPPTARRLCLSLVEAHIEHRVIQDDRTLTILVRHLDLEAARFLLATVSFSRPAALHAPLRETGHAKWSRLVTGAALGLVAALVVLGLVAFAPSFELRSEECPGAGGSHIAAVRGGCLGPPQR